MSAPLDLNIPLSSSLSLFAWWFTKQHQNYKFERTQLWSSCSIPLIVWTLIVYLVLFMDLSLSLFLIFWQLGHLCMLFLVPMGHIWPPRITIEAYLSLYIIHFLHVLSIYLQQVPLTHTCLLTWWFSLLGRNACSDTETMNPAIVDTGHQACVERDLR